jgi:hypothetical protein
MDELHDVQITNPQSGNLLIYDASTSPIGVWKNANLTDGTGITITEGAGSVTITNTGVTSITGTANQITASASTGGVTLSLPATINVNTSGNAATATSATSATNIAGGTANQIPYQTGAGATAFITAPTVSSTVLTWNGSAFTWGAGGGGSSTFPRELPVKNRAGSTIDVVDTVFDLSTKLNGIFARVMTRNGAYVYCSTNLI